MRMKCIMNERRDIVAIEAPSGAEQAGRDARPLPPEGVLLTKADVARIYQVTTRSIENWARNGWLSPTRVGHTIRFRRETLP